jgi:MFS family permease
MALSKPVARRALYALFAANAISMTGNNLAALAIPWFVLATTGSATQTGITAFFAILPVIIATFFGGTLVDRVGYKRMSLIADVASGLTIVLIPLLYQAGMLEFWLLQVLVFMGGLLDAPGATARSALLPELAEAAEMPLERAGSLLQIMERGSRLVGAPLGGLLIALMGADQVIWLNAATFLVSVVLVALWVPTIQLEAKEVSTSYVSDLMEGLRFLKRDGLLMTITLTVLVTNMLDAARGSVIMPVLAQETYDSSVALGLMFGTSGGGAVIGALLFSAWGHRLSRRWLYLGCFIIVSLGSFTLAALPPLPVALLSQLIVGIASGPINPILSAVQYERIPATMRGRVFGTITAGAFTAMPMGVLLAGYLLDSIGLQVALIITGSLYLLTTLAQIFNPTLREMERRPAPNAEREVAASSHSLS